MFRVAPAVIDEVGDTTLRVTASARPYKQPLSLERSVEILSEGRGSHFDPRLLDAFLAIAATLHATYSGREEGDLAKELQTASAPYFAEVAAG